MSTAPLAAEPPTSEPAAAEPQRRTSTFRRLLRDPQAVISAALLLIIFTAGLLTPLITSHGPNDANLDAIDAGPGTPGYLLGGDSSGRDIYARLLNSVNTSLVSALIAASIALAIGVTAGLIGGYFGTRVRFATEWLFNLLMTFPGLLLLIVLMPVTKGDYRATMAIFGVLMSPGIYRLVRNQVVGVKNELFVDAARVSGLSNLRILGRHVLFVVRGPVIIAAAFLAGGAIGLQAGLAFLGLGSSETASFGSMVSEGFHNLYNEPLQFLWPSLLLGLINASFVLFGNALRDTLEGAQPKPGKRSQPGKARTPTAKPARSKETEPVSGLLTIEDLAIAYPTPSGELHEVVSGVTFTINAGEVLGVVGESGSGKTQTAFAALGVLPPEAFVTRGSIKLDGQEILDLSERELRALRGKFIAYVPQEPMSNLDPAFTVGSQLVEGLRATTGKSRSEARAHILALLARVGIADPERTFASYPHQISGGMAQRVLIAGAVACRPKLLIADEPTTALDVTVQAEILDLLRELQEELNMAVLLVTHNFGVVADICERLAVMRQGEIVETGPVLDILRDPQHDYTRMLLAAILDDNSVRSDQDTSDSGESRLSDGSGGHEADDREFSRKA
ncbi:dipeptide/oligopeptide/nickel ABC transporter permease/ATP-binding protein [Yinghuangia sp. ASG 101]|uniref:dipeptide/oligopeptide/nickel ABC transporter permease/ATP-binding protein n=1 Tax=Yinghuangia sp. ASG 101 TaxID=2896848 RepID=UPI001E310725|nr:dipeptide/oligopeptide/nickel ABC transporter permease/ATP-binding protein [Yinghuangia sp. ASG 101]UGQ13966.1 dipeptide/oligopeptide/nickel ABC transporter permease/ATP-binding protein [Yinghuangia sp. ASG 101]